MSDTDINRECQRICEDIEEFRDDLFHGSLKIMCEKCHKAQEQEGGREWRKGKDVEDFYDRYKKMFQRRPWVKKNANRRTHAALCELRRLIGRTEEYRINASVLPPALRAGMKKISEDLEEALKKRDAGKKE